MKKSGLHTCSFVVVGVCTHAWVCVCGCVFVHMYVGRSETVMKSGLHICNFVVLCVCVHV